ncbi:hypothetical protein BWI96_13165 [Siphonobacter sp. SORGH_AS_0500]|uniref:IS1-like element transposase n=1 Tax=Siphonobacter sp. SORGH_AS_0500 TaxID=1864824 RepID=UPI000CB623C2|nr:hypothetical protein BWI96_13165 [Siphonobacter sp. SORGH_AS_0500]
MVYEAVKCKHCGSPASVKRHGITPLGKPRLRCYSCGKTFVHQYVNRGYEPAIRKQIIEMALNGNGIRETARVLKISTSTVIKYLKKT